MALEAKRQRHRQEAVERGALVPVMKAQHGEASGERVSPLGGHCVQHLGACDRVGVGEHVCECVPV